MAPEEGGEPRSEMDQVWEVVGLETKGVEVREDEKGIGEVAKEEFFLMERIAQIESPNTNVVPIDEVQKILDENVGAVHEDVAGAERRSSEGDPVEEEGRRSDGSAVRERTEIVLLERP